MTFTIRALQPTDWRKCKEFRLVALRDPIAHLAFLETLEEAEARPDELWQARANASGEGTSLRQFVAEGADGSWLGTLVGRVELPGDDTVFGGPPKAPQVHVVGVFVVPEARGTGVARELFEAVMQWSWSVAEPPVERVRLWVHQDNHRAEAFYRKAGFERTGASVVVPTEPPCTEIEMDVPRP